MKKLVVIILLVVVGYFALKALNSPDQTDVMPVENVVESEVEMNESDSDEAMSDDTMEQDASEATVKEFTLDSFNFGYSLETIEVNEGDTVTINLTNSDGFHDWVVDEFDASTSQIKAGETTSVTFTASSAGTYEYYCSVGSHRANGMVGTLVVK